jgi:hypothetical protein
MKPKLLSVAVASLVLAGSAFAQSTTESGTRTTKTETYNQPASNANTGSNTNSDANMNSGANTNSGASATSGTRHSVKSKRNNHSLRSKAHRSNAGSASMNSGSNMNSGSSLNSSDVNNGMNSASGQTGVNSGSADTSGVRNANPTYQSTTTTEQYNTTTSAPLGTGTSYGVNTYAPEQTLRSETFSFAPQFGVVTFTDATGETDSRSTVGLGLNFNMIPSSPENPKNIYLGLSTGAFYSHLGGPGSNFWGSNDNSGYNQGANLVLIPANLKLGYNISDSFRASLHGGGNVIYRSAPEAAILGSGADVNTNSWAILPNAGLDLEWQVGSNVAIIARPDVTIAPGNNMFVGTLGATIMPSF